MMDYLILIYYGFVSLLSQLLIFRILAVVFYGNELFLGAALSSWLFWVGLGSILSKRIPMIFKNSALVLSRALVIIAFLLPLELLFIRMVKTLFPFGAFIGPLPMIIVTFTALSIFCLMLGGIFPVACNFISKRKPSLALANAYLCESVGAIIAGLLFTFYFIGRVPIIIVVLLLSVGAIFFSLCIVRKSFFVVIIFVAFIFGFLYIEKEALKIEWKGYELLKHSESRYSDIAVAKLGSLVNLFEDGKITSHFPDRAFYEEIVHLPLLLHSNPRSILVGSTAAWGQLSEILKYNVDKIDYIELDPKIIKTLVPFLDSEDKNSLNDMRVNIHNIDIRTWLKNTSQKYDVVILNLPEPSNLRINRLYTKEFYKEVKQVLIPEGILAFSIPSAENYLAPNIQVFNASVYQTLKEEFKHIEFLPGDNLIFFASDSTINLNEDILVSRYQNRGISNIYVVPTYFKDRLSGERRDYVRISLGSVKTPKINSDLYPVTYYYFGKMWLAKFGSPIYFILASMVLIILIQLLRNIRKVVLAIFKYKELIPIFVMGFMGIVVEVVLLLAFQSACGFIYWQLGLLFASFMFGLALGSLFGRRCIQFSQELNAKILLVMQGTMIGMIIFIVMFFPRIYSLNISSLLMIFPILLVLDGLFVGVAFSVSGRIYHKDKTKIEDTASGVYAADILGASYGPLLAGSLLIPFFGLAGTLFVAACVGVLGLIIVMVKR